MELIPVQGATLHLAARGVSDSSAFVLVNLSDSLEPNVGFWHLASNRARALNGRYRRHSGQRSALALNGSVANDPTATLAARNRPVVDAGFDPYQSARLSRYNAVS